MEDLKKGPNYWKDKDPAKYKKMLNKLKNERKTPGSKERGYQQVLQAKRRENGQPGTKAGSNGSKGHSKNKMKTDTGTAVKRYQNSEKKAGTKLSIDRKNNSEGYGSGNTRNIPQKLNRGRHNADEKKVKEWKKKLSKSDMTLDDLYTLMVAKAVTKKDEQLLKALRDIDTATLAQFLFEGTID